MRRRRQTYDVGTMRAYLRGGYGMTISKKSGEIWIRAMIHFDNGSITEYLCCVDRQRCLFQLTERHAESGVSIMDVLKRHRMFPVNEIVRMKAKPKNVRPEICTAGA